MRVLEFIKREKVFVIASAAALVSAIFVPPDAAYINYIDFRVILILFSLMLVVASLRSCGVFDASADFLCSQVKSQRGLCMVLVMLCFVFSMFITNDVALLTFVPFAVLLLSKSGGTKYLAITVVLQTVAANLGSMCMPTGNPQNIFLFSKMDCSVADFFKILLPYSAASLALLFLCCLFVPAAPIAIKELYEKKRIRKIHSLVYAGLFLLCLLGVVRVLPFWLSAAVCAVTVFFLRKELFARVDYVLLLTFCAFFVFTGNIERIDGVNRFLQRAVEGREFLAGILSSQVISNVPAALLLYPFSKSARELLLGVNVGGLGTLVASLASLISYKLYVSSINSGAAKDAATGTKYLALFTAVNLAFMLALCAVHFILSIVTPM